MSKEQAMDLYLKNRWKGRREHGYKLMDTPGEGGEVGEDESVDVEPCSIKNQFIK